MTETTNQAPTEDIREALKDVIDPELGVNVVDLGLLYGLHYADDGALLVDMTLTTAACPLTDEIEDQVSRAIGTMVDEWRLNWVWMPPWGPERTPRTVATRCAPSASTSDPARTTTAARHLRAEGDGPPSWWGSADGPAGAPALPAQMSREEARNVSH